MSYKQLYSRTDERWLAMRSAGIGASESSAIFNAHPFMSKYLLFAIKTGRTSAAVEATEAMSWGNALQSTVMREFEKRMREEINDTVRVNEWERLLQSERWPFMLATPDCAISIDGDALGVVEIKVTSNAEFANDLPFHVWCQVQHQLAVTGAAFGYVAALVGGTKLIYEHVERDDDFIATLTKECNVFWQQVVRDDIDLFVDDDDRAISAHNAALAKYALKVLHPLDDGSTVKLDERFDAMYHELGELKAVKKGAQQRIDEIENAFRRKMGSATYGAMLSGVTASLKTTERKGSVVEPTSFRALRFVKAKKRG